MSTGEKPLLNPTRRTIRRYVNRNEREYQFAEDLIYRGCLRVAQEMEFLRASRDDVKGPIATFLVNWGNMSRVIGTLDSSWKRELASAIRKNSRRLEEFRGSKLENVDLLEHRPEIEEVYESLQKIVKPTSTSKTLHLLCPFFFPMWDVAIRKDAGVGTSSGEYYRFMELIREFLVEYDETLTDLAKKLKKSKLRIVDQYMWEASHSE